jgi:hypothetical protein
MATLPQPPKGGLLRAAPVDLIYLVISRSDVESSNFDRVLAKLEPMRSSPESAMANRGRLSISMDGYNQDPRELVEIPEARAYLRELDSRFPYGFWFFSKTDETLTIFLSASCRTASLGPEVFEVDIQAVQRYLTQHFVSVNAMVDELGLAEEELESLTDEITEYLAASFLDQGDFPEPHQATKPRQL